jgi:hypothetical protein
MRQFSHKGLPIKADAVIAVVQRTATTVEIRYSDGTNSVVLQDATVTGVKAAIDRAKANADSASDV